MHVPMCHCGLVGAWELLFLVNLNELLHAWFVGLRPRAPRPPRGGESARERDRTRSLATEGMSQSLTHVKA